MTVSQNELYYYGSANMPEADGVLTGGAVDFTKLVFFSDISPTGTMDYVSSSASDTAVTIALTGLDASGTPQTETKTLNGITLVTGSQTMERLMKGVAGGSTAVGDIAAISHTAILTGRTAQGGGNASAQVEPYIQLQAGDGASVAVGQIVRITNNTPTGAQYQLRRIVRISGDFAYVNRNWSIVPSSASVYNVYEGMLFDLAPNQVLQVRRAFYGIASDVPGGSSLTYYEKVFTCNNDVSTALTTAAVTKQVDPSGGTLDFALCNALNDTGTVANRQTAPGSGITAFSSGAAPQIINVPSPQILPNGAAPNAAGAQGIWLRYLLPAGLAPAKTSFTMRTTGNST